MDTQRLRDKILQLAIQGKLVEQDKNDEPASELLQRIKEERDKLIREGKIRKPKKLPPIKEEEKPFAIPEGWEWVRLGEIALIKMGQSPKGDTVNDNEGMEFHQGKVYFGEKYLNKSDKYTTNPKKVAQSGDILLSVRAPVGTINITDREVCIGRGLCAISGLGNIIKTYYFYTILALEEYLIKKATGTTFLAVTASTVNEMIIPLPPLAEQKRIVEKVDKLFALIDELDSNKEDLLEVINLTRNQVLQEAIQGKLVEQNPEDEPASVLIQRIKEERDKLVREGKIRKPKKLPPIKEEEKPFAIPEGWEWVRLGEISKNISKGTTPKGGRNAYKDKGIYFLRVENLTRDYNIDLSNVKLVDIDVHENQLQRSIGKENDLLISIAGTLGRVAIIKKEHLPCNMNQAICFVRVFYEKVNVDYLKYIISSLNIQKSMISKTKTTAQPNLTLGIITNLVIPLPPLAEQKRIVEKVDMIMEMLDKLEKELIINI
ncbi:restriction endonuclease subunit S [Garciella nitratireducens]|uniref:restriction endonuclease subunit S n=1 Tax=Garciella nitratireducens TaxID=218205 RepID=UPI001BD6BC33|nr:restriction endonuclease subunit S [Garciella nitratireducens]